MLSILADNDSGGALEALLRCLRSDVWNELWSGLQISVQTFETIELARNSADSVLWKVCQEREIMLVTANRNDEGPDSLESAIRMLGTPTSLPVFTLANPQKILTERTYAERVTERLLEHLIDIDKHRGVGRIWLP